MSKNKKTPMLFEGSTNRLMELAGIKKDLRNKFLRENLEEKKSLKKMVYEEEELDEADEKDNLDEGEDLDFGGEPDGDEGEELDLGGDEGDDLDMGGEEEPNVEISVDENTLRDVVADAVISALRTLSDEEEVGEDDLDMGGEEVDVPEDDMGGEDDELAEAGPRGKGGNFEHSPGQKSLAEKNMKYSPSLVEELTRRVARRLKEEKILLKRNRK